MPDLLIELYSEEIPAGMQARAAADLQRLVTGGLVEAGLTYAGAAAFSTPRRLCLAVEGLTAHSPPSREERKGPRADAPEAALAGFLRSAGVPREALEERESKKGPILFAVIERPGRPAAEIVAEVLEATIRAFPWPKSMRWGAGSLRWVRPLHGILCILNDEAGAQVVPLEVAGISSGAVTWGHPFMSPGPISVTSFEDYAAKLKRAHVVLDPAERAAAIWADTTNLAFAQGLEVIEDKGLLAEVTGLVEWPVVLMGRIDEAFLDLPAEVLQTSMRSHQRFFSVRNVQGGGGIVHFVTVANRATADGGATILAGNAKVLAARLADARFFYDNDLTVARAGMGAWQQALADVTFHARLGSVADRIARIAAIARETAPALGADPDLSERAAQLCKADLASQMVYEFPELQGAMGRTYALAGGEAPEVAEAAHAHYSPLGPGDAVPTAPVSVAVALADKIDMLTGFWAIGETPTGSKDPFALRRAALGLVRILLEAGQTLPLRPILTRSAEAFREIEGAGAPGATAESVLSFTQDRLKVHLRERGIRHDVIDAARALPGDDDLALLTQRAEALQAFLDTSEGADLVQGFRRANNILTQAEAADGVEYSYGPDRKLAAVSEERALFDALDRAEPPIATAMADGDFGAALAHMSSLRMAIDAFFEAVQVNAESAILRRNRLNLLHRIRAACLQVADLARLES